MSAGLVVHWLGFLRLQMGSATLQCSQSRLFYGLWHGASWERRGGRQVAPQYVAPQHVALSSPFDPSVSNWLAFSDALSPSDRFDCSASPANQTQSKGMSDATRQAGFPSAILGQNSPPSQTCNHPISKRRFLALLISPWVIRNSIPSYSASAPRVVWIRSKEHNRHYVIAKSK